jgi:hypothetical protein
MEADKLLALLRGARNYFGSSAMFAAIRYQSSANAITWGMVSARHSRASSANWYVGWRGMLAVSETHAITFKDDLQV